MRQLWIMILKDLRQRIRDRSVFVFSLVVPLALMGVLSLVTGGFGSDDPGLEPVTVAASAANDDQLAKTVMDTVDSQEVVDVTLNRMSADDARAAARSGAADVALIIPNDFGGSLRSGSAPTVQVVQGDGAGLETDVLISVVVGVVDQLHAASVAAAAAGSAGLPPEAIAAIGNQAAAGAPALTLKEGQASDEQLSFQGTLVAGQAGLFLMFTVGFGVLGLLAEREQGTLARLKSMPLGHGTIVASKAAVGFILGVAATGVLLVTGSLLFGVDFGSPLVVGALVLSVVAAATSLTFIVARMVRTAEQANVAQSILAMVLGIAGGAFFPIQGSGFAQTLLDINPIGAFIRGLGISAGGGGLAEVGTPIAVMLVFAGICLVIARVIPDRGARA